MYHLLFDVQNEIAFNNFNGMLASYFLPNMCDYEQYREEFPFASLLASWLLLLLSDYNHHLHNSVTFTETERSVWLPIVH